MSDSTNGSSWLERLGKVFSDELESREDLISIIKESQAAGLINADAMSMIEGVLHFSEARVKDIMVPRPQIEIIDISSPLEDILETVVESSHSRYPVMQGNKVVGVLLVKDVLSAVVKGKLETKDDLTKIYRTAVFTPESKRLNVLLTDFKTSKSHLALVIDEYDELAGLVSIEDVLEQIVGDIEDEHDIEESENIQRRVGNIFTVQAVTPLEEFNAYFGVSIETENSETIAGFMAHKLGHIPTVDESVVAQGLVISVLKANERRAELFEARPVEPPKTEDTESPDKIINFTPAESV